MSLEESHENIAKQKDEIEALSSIYGTDFHIENFEKNALSVDINEIHKTTLEVTFPLDYPTLAPPSYSLCAPWLKGLKRQELCGYLEEIYLDNVGESIVYLWVERIRQFILEEAAEVEESPPITPASPDEVDESLEECVSQLKLNNDAKKLEVFECPEIFSGDIISDRKSHFQPHLAPVQSVLEVKAVLKKLNENKKIKHATHNMYAYRFRQKGSSILCQDCDDDGETSAGGRMLHLLQILEAENVLVVVSRWYGGIKLGADRFKHINNSTRQILLSCGYIKPKEEKGKKNKKK